MAVTALTAGRKLTQVSMTLDPTTGKYIQRLDYALRDGFFVRQGFVSGQFTDTGDPADYEDATNLLLADVNTQAMPTI